MRKSKIGKRWFMDRKELMASVLSRKICRNKCFTMWEDLYAEPTLLTIYLNFKALYLKLIVEKALVELFNKLKKGKNFLILY